MRTAISILILMCGMFFGKALGLLGLSDKQNIETVFSIMWGIASAFLFVDWLDKKAVKKPRP